MNDLEYYVDDCPYCHHIIVFNRFFYQDEESSRPFSCPFCDSFINRISSPPNPHLISKEKAFFLLYKTKHKKDITDEDLKVKEILPLRFKDVQDNLRDYRKRRILKRYSKRNLKDIYDYSDTLSKDKRFDLFVKMCKVIKPLSSDDLKFLEHIIVSEEDKSIVLFLVKFIYNHHHFRDKFKNPINHRLKADPSLLAFFIDNLTPNQLKCFSNYLIDPFYNFLTRNYDILTYHSFQYNSSENLIVNYFDSYGFGKYSDLISKESLHTNKLKELPFNKLEKVVSENYILYIIERDKNYIKGFKHIYSQQILLIFNQCFESFNINSYYVPEQSIFILGDKKKDLCAFISLSYYYYD